MKGRDFVCTLVVKSNGTWPFSRLNRLPYRAALGAALRLCRRHSLIKSLYLRHGLVTSNWVPGISDIDLTIVLENTRELQKEYRCLVSFREAYEGLRRLFPMLGELCVLSETDVSCWQRFGLLGSEARNWQLLYGVDTLGPEEAVDPASLRIHSFRYGVEVYLETLLKIFYEPHTPSYIRRKRMQRLCSKITRYAGDDGRVARSASWITSIDGADTAYECLLVLSRGARRIGDREHAGSFPKQATWLQHFALERASFDAQRLDLSELQPYESLIESVIQTIGRVFVILRGEYCRESVSCIEAVREVFSRQGIRPLILTVPLFHFLLRVHNPYFYAGLTEFRMVRYGADPLPSTEPPDEHTFATSVVEQTPNVLKFPRSGSVFRPAVGEPSRDQLTSIVDRAMRIRLFLEHGKIIPVYYSAQEECRRLYRVFYERLDELAKDGPERHGSAVPFPCFEFLRHLSDELRDLVMRVVPSGSSSVSIGNGG